MVPTVQLGPAGLGEAAVQPPPLPQQQEESCLTQISQQCLPGREGGRWEAFSSLLVPLAWGWLKQGASLVDIHSTL